MDHNGQIEARRKLVLDELNYTATRITELARIVGVGLAGLIFFFSTSSSEFARVAMRQHGDQILYLSIYGGFILLVEYIQFILARIALGIAATHVNDLSTEIFVETNASKLATWVFRFKQVIAFIGMAWFAIFLFSLTSIPLDSQYQSNTNTQQPPQVSVPAIQNAPAQ